MTIRKLVGNMKFNLLPSVLYNTVPYVVLATVLALNSHASNHMALTLKAFVVNTILFLLEVITSPLNKAFSRKLLVSG